MSLLALPASWRGLPAEELLLKFAEAVGVSVSVDVSFARLGTSQPASDSLRVVGAACPARAPEAAAWFASLTTRKVSTVGPVPCAELGELSAAYEPLGYHGSVGFLVVASRRPGFPTQDELAVIRAAAAVATTAAETVRAMRERELALRAKDDFLAVLGHELRNPLAPVTTALEIIRQRNEGHRSREEQLIERQVDHLRKLVDDLLDVARIERGGIEKFRRRFTSSSRRPRRWSRS